MRSLLSKLWRSSPESLTRAVRRRIDRRTSRPDWFTIKGGPLAGASMFLPSGRRDGWGEFVNGTFDAYLYHALSRKCTLDGKRCWDIGAHIGYHSLSFAALGAQVVSFEPNPYNRTQFELQLTRNPKLATRIKVLPIALSDQDSEMVFVQSSQIEGAASGSHLVQADAPLGHDAYSGPLWERTQVATRRIDTLLEEGEPAPDVVKIDVEGAEAMVLKGGCDWLKNHRPLLLIEVHQISLLLEIQEMLLKWNYTIELLDKQNASAHRSFIVADRR